MAKTKTTTTANTDVTTTTVTTVPVVAPAPAKAPKQKSSKTVDAAAVAVAVVPVVAAASVESTPKKVKAAKTPKTDAAATPATASKVVAVAETEPATPVGESAIAADVHQVSSDFSSFSTKLQQVSALLSALKTEFRTLERKASRELKTATKAGAKRKRKTGNRSPSGFVKPTLISSELATFLGKTQGTEMARTEVTREINAYIRANSLQDKTNGRKINADSKLSTLLKLNAGEELTYFNLQRYMSPHFQKAAAAALAAAAASVPVA